MQSATFRFVTAAVTMLLLVALLAAIGLAIRDNSHIALVTETPIPKTDRPPAVSAVTPSDQQEIVAQTAAPAIAAQSVLTGVLPLGDAATAAERNTDRLDADQTVTPTPAPDALTTLSLIALGPIERVVPGGFSFQSPSEYEVMVTGSAVNMQAADADPAIGPIFLLSGGPPGQFVSGSTSSLEAIFAQFIDFFAARDNFSVENQRIRTMSSLRGLAADIASADDVQGEPFAGQIFMARPGANQIFVMVGIAPAARWADSVAAEYEAVLNSVETFVPGEQNAETAAVAPSVSGTPAALATESTPFSLAPAAATATLRSTPRGTSTARSSPTAAAQLVSAPQWQVLSNGNFVNGIAVADETIWAASDGGVVAWNLQGGAATKFTTMDGLESNVITAARYCPIATLGMVFGSEAGLQVLDLRSRSWRTLNSANSPMAFDSVNALYCDVEAGFLVVGYANQGLDIFDANAAEWTYISLADNAQIYAVTAVDALAEIWIGIDAGVLVISNGAVTQYDSQNSPLPNAPVRALSVTPNGSIWLTAADALFQVTNADGQRQWRRFDAGTVVDSAFPDGLLTGVAGAGEETIWVASEEVQICQFEPQTERCIREFSYSPRQQNGLVAGPLTSLTAVDGLADSNIYYTTAGNGFSRFAQDRWQAFALEQEPVQGNQIRHIVQADSGVVWLAANGGVQQIDPADLSALQNGGLRPDAPAVQRFAQFNSELFSDDIQVLQPDRTGGIWLGAEGAGYYDGATWSSYSTVDGLVGGLIQAITIDQAQRVWFGSSEGLSIFNGDAFFSLTEAEGLPSNEVTALLADRSSPGNIVWIGTRGGGLLRFDKNQIQVYNRNNASLPSNTVTALAQDADGSLLIGTDRGVARFNNERATTIRPIGAATISVIAVAPNGSVWVGTADSGVYHFNGLAWEQYTSRDILPAQHVTTILADQDGLVWIGCANGGLVRYIHE